MKKMIRIRSLWLLQFLCCTHAFLVNSLSTEPSSASCDRRKFISNNVIFSTTVGSLTSLLTPFGASADNALEITVNPSKNDYERQIYENQFERISSLLNAKSISWEGPPWSSSRYRYSTLSTPTPSSRTSSLSSKTETTTTAAPGPIAILPTVYPPWMEGYFTIQYKFTGASFPQGKSILSIRTAGAGLGTCLSLPNVGYAPRSAFAVRYLTNNDGNGEDSNGNGNSGKNRNECYRDGGSGVYEDLAYNYPRRLEAFWPDAKVLAVQTDGGNDATQKGNVQSPMQDQSKTTQRRVLTPRCFVTGEGCTSLENPDLHSPSSRIRMEFEAPTRRSGRMRQSTDVTLLAQRQSSRTVATNEEDCHSFGVVKTFSQWNGEQDVQTFYEEISIYKLLDNAGAGREEKGGGRIILGSTRVAAFLPKYIKAEDNGRFMKNDDLGDYKEEEAVALYDYKFVMNQIDEAEASST